jgi:glycosyltransferase involved in cell wall biosynthesis
VIRVLQDPELAEDLAINARDELRNYSWDVARGQWLELYSSLAGL